MFNINGVIWNLKFVSPYSKLLMRSNGTYTIGMTDAETQTIYLSDDLYDGLLHKVIRHELCHAYCISYGIYLPIEFEEILCDSIATYGESIIDMSRCINNNLCKYYGKC